MKSLLPKLTIMLTSLRLSMSSMPIKKASLLTLALYLIEGAMPAALLGAFLLNPTHHCNLLASPSFLYAGPDNSCVLDVISTTIDYMSHISDLVANDEIGLA